MKKALCIALCCLALSAAGCSADEADGSVDTTAADTTAQSVILGETEAVTTRKAVEGAAVPGAQDETQPPTETTPPPESGKPEVSSFGIIPSGKFSLTDTFLKYKGATLSPGGIVTDSMRSALGEPNSVQSAPSCLHEGEDKTYVYGDLIIYTYQSGKQEKISDIEIKGDGISTLKGLKTGLTLEDAEKIYGKEYTKDGILIKYTANKSAHLYICFTNGKISSWGLSED